MAMETLAGKTEEWPRSHSLSGSLIKTIRKERGGTKMGPWLRKRPLVLWPLTALFLIFQTLPGAGEGSNGDLQQRLERLEKLVQEQKNLLERYEKEMDQLKSDLKKQSETIDEKVKAAATTPDHVERLKEIMSDIRLTETK
jgi:hypothetical protein